MVFDNFFNLILGWVNIFGSPYNVIIISFLITLLVTLAYKFLTDQRISKTNERK